MNENSITSPSPSDASPATDAKPPVLRQKTLFPEHDARWLALINRVIEAELPDEGEPVNGSLFQGELFEAERENEHR